MDIDGTDDPPPSQSPVGMVAPHQTPLPQVRGGLPSMAPAAAHTSDPASAAPAAQPRVVTRQRAKRSTPLAANEMELEMEEATSATRTPAAMDDGLSDDGLSPTAVAPAVSAVRAAVQIIQGQGAQVNAVAYAQGTAAATATSSHEQPTRVQIDGVHVGADDPALNAAAAAAAHMEAQAAASRWRGTPEEHREEPAVGAWAANARTSGGSAANMQPRGQPLHHALSALDDGSGSTAIAVISRPFRGAPCAKRARSERMQMRLASTCGHFMAPRFSHSLLSNTLALRTGLKRSVEYSGVREVDTTFDISKYSRRAIAMHATADALRGGIL